VGYPVLGLLVGLESAGVPLPGETALITASVLAKHGGLEIEAVIGVAAVAAIIGDNLGYLVSRRYGRGLLTRPGRTQARRLEVLARGEAFFDRHGPKAVFFGRWIAGLRVWASWLAGITHMPYRDFLLWNALGGISWAITVGVVGYVVGTAAEEIVTRAGLGAAVLAAVLVVGALVVLHVRRQRHRPREPEPERLRTEN
jgi:membrane protein DedA with SNARE-associated domain